MSSAAKVRIADYRDLGSLYSLLINIDEKDASMLRYYEVLKAKHSSIWRILFLLKLLIQLIRPLTMLLRKITLYYIIYLFQGKIVGYCLVEYRLDSGVAVLRQIYTMPEFRGKGYGSTLLKLTIRLAHIIGAKMVVLEVLYDNIIARRLYEKYGFKYVKKYDNIAVYLYTIKWGKHDK